MSDRDVTVSIADGIAVISIARPPVNAFRTQTWNDLESALEEVATAPRCNVVILRSSVERIFSAGADVKELPMAPATDEARQRLTRRVLDRVLRFPVPIICSVSGTALGSGCALAAACDIRLATQDASFGLPEINVGRAGGSRHLMRVLPQGIVRRLYFTGRPLAAEEAWRVGMVLELAPDAANLDRIALTLATEIAQKSPTAIRLAKQSLDLVESMPIIPGYEMEQQFSLRLAGTPDAEEAARAFREKRAPRWVEE